MLIRGELLVEGDPFDLSGASVHVQLLDTSRADAASITISQFQVQALARGTTTSDRIPFEFNVDNLDPRGYYILAAHIDINGDGQKSIGDYITMESFPLYTEDPSIYYVIKVRRINP
jgi:hypothetical protein